LRLHRREAALDERADVAPVDEAGAGRGRSVCTAGDSSRPWQQRVDAVEKVSKKRL
jgi:hypothetical protein